MFHMAMYLRQLVALVLYYVTIMFLFLVAMSDAVSVSLLTFNANRI